eukprot:TRINITY_DN22627_c0_g1_i1.p1 TRINITY_DN22627_c0_g1~~TRINITY_DN22627_c0_g1_i1.p1  ORF type:complete len:167 (+),score=41.69 TRINITY_DN22627_c0_g1_i1:1-501(+)
MLANLFESIENFEKTFIHFLQENEIDYFGLELIRVECFLQIVNFLQSMIYVEINASQNKKHIKRKITKIFEKTQRSKAKQPNQLNKTNILALKANEQNFSNEKQLPDFSLDLTSQDSQKFKYDDQSQPEVEKFVLQSEEYNKTQSCLLYTSPSPRDRQKSRMPSSA